jgi:hypothetical protein
MNRMLTADEEGVTSKDGLASAILQEVADAILGVAGSVDVGHLDIAQLRDFVVLRSLCYSLAILATDDSQVGGAELSKLQIDHGKFMFENLAIWQLSDSQASCFLQHGPNGCRMLITILYRESRCCCWVLDILVGIDNGSQVDPARADRLLEHWNHPIRHIRGHAKTGKCKPRTSYSGGLAGSMITASLDLSSITR